MSYRSAERYYGSVNGVTVKITEVTNQNNRRFRVSISTKGVQQGAYYSPPILGSESFVNVENLLSYIKQHTGCSDYEVNTIKSAIL